MPLVKSFTVNAIRVAVRCRAVLALKLSARRSDFGPSDSRARGGKNGDL